MDYIKILQELSISNGVSGGEGKTRDILLEYLKKYSNNIKIDNLGNILCVIKEAKNSEKMIMLDAHIDEVGMIVRYIDDNGFIKVSNCGGVDNRILGSQRVIVHGIEDIIGTVSSKPPHLMKKNETNQVVDISDIIIDVGYSKENLEKIVSVGDYITFESDPKIILNNRFIGKALDDRAGAVCILKVLEDLDIDNISCGLSILFSVQEEVGTRGAEVGCYTINPDIAIAVDVSFAHTVDADITKCGYLGEGSMIGISPILSKEISDKFIEISKRKDIKYQLEIMGGKTGTNADKFSVSRNGVKTGLISIPLRYMHTPIEMISIEDLNSVSSILQIFIQEVE